MAHTGYDKLRFTSSIPDNFDCIICSEVVIDPNECHGCGKLFCGKCIADWASKNPQTKCPNRCANQITPIFSKALSKLYSNFEIKCSNAKCQKPVKIAQLKKHQQDCLKTKCWNYDQCNNIAREQIKSLKPVCSKICDYLYHLNANFGNNKKMYDIIGDLIMTSSKYQKSSSFTSNLINDLVWDNKRCGSNVTFADGNKSVYLKEQQYVFRSVIATDGFTSGINYWEIIADARTQNQLKIGVTTNRQFDLNSAFCDHSFGFAYYGLAQLRHNSNATGPSYGKKFKKEGVLGCCLNMNTGTLSFALNGQYMGVAYNDTKLKSGVIYPAVSLLHCAGCKIRYGMPVPSYFTD